MKSTGEKIRDQRRILGMTQQKLAEAAGMTNRTVSKYETDMVVPRGMNLKKLCSVLHVSQAYLLTPNIEDPSYGLDEAPYVEAAQEAYGKKARLWKVPRAMMRLVASVGSVLHLPLNRERLGKLTENSIRGSILPGVTLPPVGIRNSRMQDSTKDSATDSAP